MLQSEYNKKQFMFWTHVFSYLEPQFCYVYVRMLSFGSR